nr:immunoglobulin heavy chain junction region [Macaca mulatta]MOY23014.1 immunoglobulin heavy chain junction region [Macaca mulatta]MOY24703.1 immunoglobulin heavy chain junction region [Macaca mulatta]MOY24744.1 immunoglobulin heavy chain junction region [Macaca mulatta]MOY26518.1 immunoglobulin heavy chain junction region [Macaca mulatta]
CVRKQANFDSW